MKPILRLAYIAFCATLLLASPAAFSADTPAPASHGIALNNLDRSVNPGDDFFRFANGEWLKRTDIPADRGSIGVFVELDNLASKRTAGIIEDVAKTNSPSGCRQDKFTLRNRRAQDRRPV
jgi:predicted metalloendopeptidase